MNNDLQLKQQVISRLELEPKIDPATLDVSVEDGIVTLRGSVDNEADRASTERVVRVMRGVKGLVDDDLQVRSAPRLRRPDRELEQDASEAVKWLTTAPQENIKVTARNGWLNIAGEAESPHQAQCITALLKEIPGVRGIKGSLNIRPECRAA